MNKNRPHDESGSPSPKQGTRKDRIKVLLADIEDQINLQRQSISYDELSAYELAQLQVKYWNLYIRLLTLLVKVEDNEPTILQVAKYNLMGEPKIIPGQPTPPDRLFLLEDEDEDEDEELKG